MNKKNFLNIFRMIITVLFMLALFPTRGFLVSASTLMTLNTTDKIIVPMPFITLPTIKLTKLPHPSGNYAQGLNGASITNISLHLKNSLDFSYTSSKPSVVAPISGTILIYKDCGSGGQVIFIKGEGDLAIGISHIVKRSNIVNGMTVVQGQKIGEMISSQNNSCGYITGPHVHFSLMSYIGNKFTEQNLVGAYIGQWKVYSDKMVSRLTGNYVAVGGTFDDYAKIISVRSGNVAEISSTKFKINVFSTSNLSQQWDLLPVPNARHYYFLYNRGKNLCLSVIGGSLDNGATIYVETCSTGKPYQFFKFTSIQGLTGIYAIQVKHSGKVLDVVTNWTDPYSGRQPGTRIQQYEPPNNDVNQCGNNQQWRVSKP